MITMTNKCLAEKITWLFVDNDMLQGSTSYELMEATERALNSHDKESINVMLEYFSEMRITNNEDARQIYFELQERLK